MGYQHGKTPQPANTMLTIEQARRVNAELRRELAALMLEQADLSPKVEAMRDQVSAARKKLSRQIRDLDSVRAQSDRIAAAVGQEPQRLPEPIHGGREGLQAAADELQAHEEKGTAGSTVRRRKGRSHGTNRMYESGCRCDECRAWRKRKSERERLNVKRRREEYRALKAAAEVAA